MKHYLILITLTFLMIFSYCSKPNQLPNISYISLEEARLKKLEELQKSILKITSTCYYQNYYYSYPKSDKQATNLESMLYRNNITSNSVAGTGLILKQKLRKQLLLTCYHVFDFEDTLKTYYYDENKNPTNYLSSLSVKSGQNIFIYHNNGSRSHGEIISYDPKNDLALIECDKIEIMFTELQFQGVIGSAQKLKLGQEIYLLGFPKGFFMVTKGLVSPTNFKNKLMVDALFNRGFSGGICIHFLPGEPEYEYIGMSNSIAYSSEMILAPSDEPQIQEQYKNAPYQGNIFIKELKMINYGLTFVIKSDVVLEFLQSENDKLKQLGYDFSNY